MMMDKASYIHGKTPKPERDRHDFYPTPHIATQALCNVEKFDGPIWEPACGDGAISNVLKQNGYKVISTDLIDRGYGKGGKDFLNTRKLLAPNIITNPPFKYSSEFVRHAIHLGCAKLALLCRVEWLASKKRKSLFETTPLAQVWVFSTRLSMARGGARQYQAARGMMEFAWFIWLRGYAGKPTLGWV